jgi:glycine/D-amino acid oxidase-like deaminating enzyme
VVVIFGGGPSGLTTAIKIKQLAHAMGVEIDVIVVSEPLPLASDMKTPRRAAFPQAAAYLQPFQAPKDDPRITRWFRETLDSLRAPEDSFGNGGGHPVIVDSIHREATGFRPSWAEGLPTGELFGDDIPPPWAGAFRWEGFAFDPQDRRAELVYAALTLGVRYHEASIESLLDVRRLARRFDADVVVDALGISSGTVFGDERIAPRVGHLLIYPNIWGDQRVLMVDDDLKYVISGPRFIFIGGTYIELPLELLDEADLRLFPDYEEHLFEALLQLRPDLYRKIMRNQSALQHQVGIRPYRTGGPRLEWEDVDGIPPVLHVTGLGGSGWSLYWGITRDAARMLLAALLNRDDNAV